MHHFVWQQKVAPYLLRAALLLFSLKATVQSRLVCACAEEYLAALVWGLHTQACLRLTQTCSKGGIRTAIRTYAQAMGVPHTLGRPWHGARGLLVVA